MRQNITVVLLRVSPKHQFLVSSLFFMVITLGCLIHVVYQSIRNFPFFAVYYTTFSDCSMIPRHKLTQTDLNLHLMESCSRIRVKRNAHLLLIMVVLSLSWLHVSRVEFTFLLRFTSSYTPRSSPATITSRSAM